MIEKKDDSLAFGSKSTIRLGISFHNCLEEEMEIYELLRSLKGLERSSLVSKAITFYLNYNDTQSTKILDKIPKGSNEPSSGVAIEKTINENENFIEEVFELPPENQKKADPEMMAAISSFTI